MWKYIVGLVVLGGAVGVAAAWIMAGNAPGPSLRFLEPTAVGRLGELVLEIETPGGELTELEVTLEQRGDSFPIFSMGMGALASEGENRRVLRQPLGREQYESLVEGEATLTARAVRPVLFGYRESEATTTHEFEVRLRPPIVNVQSQFHYINHGGSEMVVYRVSPAPERTGVMVGEREFPGFPAAGAGVAGADDSLFVSFFALGWDQDRSTPITVFAVDELGNQSSSPFDYRVFAKEFRASTINIGDSFLSRVVPSILQNSPEFRVDDPTDLLASYVAINREMRSQNDAYIRSLAERSAPEILWNGPFRQLINTAVESGFADQREYVYNGEVIDHQTHLGFDLASTAAAPVTAANSGRIVHAGWLGIYGNCVIIDHGMGLHSLYAHLSSIDVREGDAVAMSQQLGRSGATGLAGGDHLHFTMLLNGYAITPIDWWSQQWVDDRIIRKLREAE
ncbi:MAG TPA: M23 family metallopeptidase [Gammaproteobacteria bacterium]|jgi:murein DD-endopeptidase MepM/ murein hydrolase activator NlpD